MLAERAPGDGLVESEPDVVEQVQLVALGGDQIVGAAAEQIGGKRPLGEQSIGSGGAPHNVGHQFEHADDGADLVGPLLAFVGVGPQPFDARAPWCRDS